MNFDTREPTTQQTKVGGTRRQSIVQIMLRTIFLGATVLFCVSHAQTPKHGKDNSVCVDPTPPPSIISNKVKPNVTNQYHTRVECVIVNNNLTTDVHEYFDADNNRGMVRQLGLGIEFYAWYDYNTNEFIGYYPTIGDKGQCFVSDLSTSDQRYLLGYNVVNGKPHIYSANSALHFGGKGINEVYMGKDIVRGIRVDKWSSCQYWADMDATMAIDWYFTDETEWDSAVGISIPVRAHVKGRVYTGNSQSHDFDHYYEFFHFFPFIEGSDNSVFETPSGVQCPGRKNTKPLPTVPSDAFSFTTEILDNRQNTISFMDEYFDYKDKLVKYDYRPLPTEYSPYGTNHIIEIHDFNTGVAYITDVAHGNCTIQTIEQGTFDDKTLPDARHVRMRSSREFFYFDSTNYTYEGVKKNRNIDCDSWIGFRSDFPTKQAGVNSTWEWYFATSDWTETNPGQEVGGIPIQMRVSAPLLNFDYNYNIYDFKKHQPDLLKFDISACYMMRNRRVLQFLIPGSFIPSVSSLEDFKFAILNAITRFTGVSPLRVSHLQTYFDQDIVVTFELLDVAPIVGDVTKAVREVPLDVAADTLTNVINGGQFVITFDKSNNNYPNLNTIVVKQNSIVMKTYQNETIYKTTDQEVQGYPPGAMAGIGVSMPIVGVGMGIAFAYFFFK